MEYVLLGVGLIVLFILGSIIVLFIVAGIIDWYVAVKRRKDLFYQLKRDHNAVKRPARK